MQKEVDNQHDQNKRFDKGFNNLINRNLYEIGNIVRDLILDPLGEILADPIHRFTNLFCRLDRIGTALQKDPHRDCRGVVELRFHIVTLGTEFYRRYVFEFKCTSVGVGAHDDV